MALGLVSFHVRADSGCTNLPSQKEKVQAATQTAAEAETFFVAVVENLRHLAAEKTSRGWNAGESLCWNEQKSWIAPLLKKIPPEAQATPTFQKKLAYFYQITGARDHARDAFIKVLERAPLDATANWELAQFAEVAGDNEAQLSYLQKAVSEKAHDAQERALQLKVYPALVLQLDLAAAATTIQRWRELDPTSLAALFAAAENAASRRDTTLLTEILKELTPLAKSTDDAATLLFWRAQLSQLFGTDTATAELLAQYLEATHDKAVRPQEFRLREARRLLSEVYLKMGQGERARRVIEVDLERNPKDLRLKKLHETSFVNSPPPQNWDEFQELKRSALGNPRSVPLQLRIVEALWTAPFLREKLGDTERLKSLDVYLEKILVLDPSNLDGLYLKGVLAMERKAFTRADMYLAQVLQQLREGKSPLPPREASELWIRIAELEAARGRTGEVRALLNEGLASVVTKEGKERLRKKIESLGS